jgi:hypothetical protein
MYSQRPPLAEKEWQTTEGTWSGRPSRDLNARSDQRIGMPAQEAVDRLFSPLRSGRERPAIDWQ